MNNDEKPKRLHLPVVSQGAEFLVQGYLARRNILTYKAPPNNRGYDLICIHPAPEEVKRVVRIQVKSRYATDSDRSLDINDRTFEAFDFLVAVFLNVGYYLQNRTGSPIEGRRLPEFYTFPVKFVRKHCDRRSSRQKLRTKNLDIDRYKGDDGFEQIAKMLRVDYPDKVVLADDQGPTTDDAL